MDERGAMTCQLCGHENRYDVQDCALCGATLHLEGGVQAVPDEAIDVSQTRVSTRRLAVTLLLLAACALPWYLMCDLFQVPVEVVASRKAHAELKKRYAQNPTVWGKQKDQIVAVMQAPMALSQHIADDLVFDSLPLEVLEAYVEEDLGLNAQRYPSLCWYLRPDSKRPTFILSKYEGKGGPFAVTLSLEAAIQSRGDSISIDILRLRRGSREIAPSLTWTYFGPELQAIRRMEELAGGITDLKVSQRTEQAKIAGCDPLFLSWRYQAHGLQLSPRQLN